MKKAINRILQPIRTEIITFIYTRLSCKSKYKPLRPEIMSEIGKCNSYISFYNLCTLKHKV